MTNIGKHFSVVAMIMMLLTIASCSSIQQTYPGTRLAPDQVATIKDNPKATGTCFMTTATGFVAESISESKYLHILAIDGKSVNGRGTFEILPGKHTLDIGMELVSGGYGKVSNIEFTAAAGRHYILHLVKDYAIYSVSNGELADFEEERIQLSVIEDNKP